MDNRHGNVGDGMERVVSIAGISVSIAADDIECSRALDELFGRCAPAPGAGQIRVHHEAVGVDLPGRVPDAAVAGIDYWFDPDGVSTRNFLGAAGRRFGDVVSIAGSHVSEPDRAFRLAVQLPLIDAFSGHGRHILHAAAVESEGAAVIVLGNSGDGKSTFAFGAMRHGWKMLADDLSVVHAADDRMVVSGFPKPVNVPADVLGEPPPEARAIAGDDRRRWNIGARDSIVAGPYPITAVVYVGHSPGDATTERLVAAPALIRDLLLAHPLAELDRVRRSFFPLAGRLSRLPTYRYHHSSDPAQRVRGVADFLDAISAPDLARPSLQ